MRPIGFSTGALALSNFRLAMAYLENKDVDSIELSALRVAELRPLLESLPALDLTKYKHIGVHAPSRFGPHEEIEIFDLLRRHVPPEWPIVLHPDTIHDFSLWTPFGKQLAIENMDRRKPIGRTVEELAPIFEMLPNASLAFDIGHARQCDTTMTEAYRILTHFEDRLAWMHVSEVNTLSRHEPLSYAAIWAFAEVANLIPKSVPVILEARVDADAIDAEIEKAQLALSAHSLQSKTA
jgi:hypothetical protein